MGQYSCLCKVFVLIAGQVAHSKRLLPAHFPFLPTGRPVTALIPAQKPYSLAAYYSGGHNSLHHPRPRRQPLHQLKEDTLGF